MSVVLGSQARRIAVNQCNERLDFSSHLGARLTHASR